MIFKVGFVTSPRTHCMAAMTDTLVELVTFDAEGTLVCYRSDVDDGQQYARAYDAFSQATPEMVSRWPQDVGSKWLEAYRREIQRWRDAEAAFARGDAARPAPNTRPWMSLPDAVRFYSALSRTFLELCGMPVLERHNDYVRFLMFDWYMSEAVYRRPVQDTKGFARLVAQFPSLPMFVVSNTDSRIRDVVQLFPEYRSVFRGRVLTACDVDSLKPSADGILFAATLSGVIDTQSKNFCGNEASTVGRNEKTPKFWLHVGDSLKDDGGASKAADAFLQTLGERRCLFMHCDGKSGVNFDHVLAVVSSASPAETLAELGYRRFGGD